MATMARRAVLIRGLRGTGMIFRIALAMVVLTLLACGPDTAEQRPVTGTQTSQSDVAAASPVLCARSAAVRPDEIESRFLSALAAPILGFAAEKIFDVLMATVTEGGDVATAGASHLAGAVAGSSNDVTADCITPDAQAPEPALTTVEGSTAGEPNVSVSATLAVATYLDDGGPVLRQIEPGQVIFRPADRIVLRTTANLPGIHRLLNRTPDGRLVALGVWPTAAGEVHDIGPLQFAGQAGTDQVIFRFLPCSDPGTSGEARIAVAADEVQALPSCRDVQLSGRSSGPTVRDMFIADRGKNHYASAALNDLVRGRQLQRPLTTELSFTHSPGQG